MTTAMPPLVDDDKDELLLSCRYGDLEDVQAFVDRHGSSPLADIRDENQNTTLHMAAGNGHLGMRLFTHGLRRN
jgi:ankyrin repeat protein